MFDVHFQQTKEKRYLLTANEKIDRLRLLFGLFFLFQFHKYNIERNDNDVFV